MKIAIVAALVATLAASCDAGSKSAELPQQTVQPNVEANTPQQVEPSPLKEPADETAQPARDMHEHSTKSVASEGVTFTRVEPSQVCMVNNQYMGREQIPVVVQGKTYFGCCEMCKGTLANEPSSRAARDPVSGKTVDKAAAVIGRDASGAVQYFENEKNFETYASR